MKINADYISKSLEEFNSYPIAESNDIFTKVDISGGAHMFTRGMSFSIYYKSLSPFMTTMYYSPFNAGVEESKKLLQSVHSPKDSETANEFLKIQKKLQYLYPELQEEKVNPSIQREFERLSSMIDSANKNKKSLTDTQINDITRTMFNKAHQLVQQDLRKRNKRFNVSADIEFFKKNLKDVSAFTRTGTSPFEVELAPLSEQTGEVQLKMNKLENSHYAHDSNNILILTNPKHHYQTQNEILGLAPNSYGGYNVVKANVHFAHNGNKTVLNMEDTGIMVSSHRSKGVLGMHHMITSQGHRKGLANTADFNIYKTLMESVYDTSVGGNTTIDDSIFTSIKNAQQKIKMSTSKNFLSELHNLSSFTMSNGMKTDSVRDSLDFVTLTSGQYEQIINQYQSHKRDYENINLIFGKGIDRYNERDYNLSFQIKYNFDDTIDSVVPIFTNKSDSSIYYGVEGLASHYGISEPDIIQKMNTELTETFQRLGHNMTRTDVKLIEGDVISSASRRIKMFDDNGNNIIDNWERRLQSIFASTKIEDANDLITKSGIDNKKIQSGVSQNPDFHRIVNEISDNIAENTIHLLGLDQNRRFGLTKLDSELEAYKNGTMRPYDFLKSVYDSTSQTTKIKGETVLRLGDNDWNNDFVSNIYSALEMSNPSRISGYLLSGNPLHNLNMVSRQTENINAKLTPFIGHTSMFAYMNIENQRHSQTDDIVTPFAPLQKTIGMMVSEQTRNVAGRESTGVTVVNETSTKLMEDLFYKYKSDEFGNNKTLQSRLARTSVPRSFQANRNMILYADTELSFQDSNAVSSNAILQGIAGQDKNTNVTLFGSNSQGSAKYVDFTKIKMFDGEGYYSADFNFSMLKKSQIQMNVDVYNPKTEIGYIVQQIMGEDNYSKMLFSRNPKLLEEELENAVSGLSQLRPSTLENVNYNAEIYDTTLSNVKGVLQRRMVTSDMKKTANIFDKNIVSSNGPDLNSGSYFAPKKMYFDNQGLHFEFQPILTSGIGSKMISSPQKLTVNSIHSMIGLVVGDQVLPVDVIANPKLGHAKRGFDGLLFGNVLTSMYTKAATTPITGELLDGETYETLSLERLSELQQNRMNRLTDVLQQKQVRLGSSSDGVSILDFFKIQATSTVRNGRIEIGFRDLRYDEMIDKYTDMLEQGLPTASIDHMTIEKLYSDARKAGMDVRQYTARAYGASMINTLGDSWLEFMSTFGYTDEQKLRNQIFYDIEQTGAQLGIAIKGQNGYEMSGVKMNGKYAILLDSYVNIMKDSISQNSDEAMKWGWLNRMVASENGLDFFNAVNFGEAININKEDLMITKALFGAKGFEPFSEKYHSVFGEGIKVSSILENNDIIPIPQMVRQDELLSTSSYGITFSLDKNKIKPITTHLDFRGMHDQDFYSRLGNHSESFGEAQNYMMFSLMNGNIKRPANLDPLHAGTIFTNIEAKDDFFLKVNATNIMSFNDEELTNLFNAKPQNYKSAIEELTQTRIKRYAELFKDKEGFEEVYESLSNIKPIKTDETSHEYGNIEKAIRNFLVTELQFKYVNGSIDIGQKHLDDLTEEFLQGSALSTRELSRLSGGLSHVPSGEGKITANIYQHFFKNIQDGRLDNIEYFVKSMSSGSIPVVTGEILFDQNGQLIHNKGLSFMNKFMFYSNSIKQYKQNEEMLKTLSNAGVDESSDNILDLIGNARSAFFDEKQKKRIQRSMIDSLLFHKVEEVNSSPYKRDWKISKGFGEYLLDKFTTIEENRSYDARGFGMVRDGKRVISKRMWEMLTGYADEYKKNGKEITFETSPLRVLATASAMIDNGHNIKVPDSAALQKEAFEIYNATKEYILSTFDDLGEYFDYKKTSAGVIGLEANLEEANYRQLVDFYDEIFEGQFNTKTNIAGLAKAQRTKMNSMIAHLHGIVLENANDLTTKYGTEALLENLSYQMKNSMSMEPTDGTALFHGIQKYITNGIRKDGSREIGHDITDSLFVSNGAIKNKKQLKKDLNFFKKTMKKTFGAMFDLEGQENYAKAFQQLEKEALSGKLSMEEFNIKAQSLSEQIETLLLGDGKNPGIDGIAYAPMEMFKNSRHRSDFNEQGFTFGAIHRNPAQYKFSTKANRIVGFDKEEIDYFPFLNMLRNQGLTNTQHIFLAGFDNFLASNGDFDGDNAYVVFSNLLQNKNFDTNKIDDYMKREFRLNAEFVNLMKKYKNDYRKLFDAFDDENMYIDGKHKDSLMQSVIQNIRYMYDITTGEVNGSYGTHKILGEMNENQRSVLRSLMERKFSQYGLELKRIQKELVKEMKTHNSIIGISPIISATMSDGRSVSLSSNVIANMLIKNPEASFDFVFSSTNSKSRMHYMNTMINNVLDQNNALIESGRKGFLSETEINSLKNLIAKDGEEQKVDDFVSLYQAFQEDKHVASFSANYYGTAGKYKELSGIVNTGNIHKPLTAFRNFVAEIADAKNSMAIWNKYEDELSRYFADRQEFSDFAYTIRNLTMNNTFGVMIEEGAISSKKGGGTITTEAFLDAYKNVFGKIARDGGYFDVEKVRKLGIEFGDTALRMDFTDFGNKQVSRLLSDIGVQTDASTNISKLINTIDLINFYDRGTGNELMDIVRGVTKQPYNNQKAIDKNINKIIVQLSRHIRDKYDVNKPFLTITLDDVASVTKNDIEDIFKKSNNYASVVLNALFANGFKNNDVALGAFNVTQAKTKSMRFIRELFDFDISRKRGSLDSRVDILSSALTEQEQEVVNPSEFAKREVDQLKREVLHQIVDTDIDGDKNVADTVEEVIKESERKVEKVIKESSNSDTVVKMQQMSFDFSEAEKVERKAETFQKTAEEVSSKAQKTMKQASETIQDNQSFYQKTKTATSEMMKTVANSESVSAMKNRLKNADGKYKLGAIVGAGALVIGGFIKMINQNRTVIDLDLHEKAMEKEKGSLYRNLGQYTMNTNIRDFY